MTDATGGRGAKGPDELRRQIEQTRSELGDTVEELAGKADVKGRARARAADLRDKAGAMTVQLRSTAAQAGHTVHDRATHAGHAVEHGVPGPVRSAVQAGKQHPRPVLVAGAAAAGAVVAVGVWRQPRGAVGFWQRPRGAVGMWRRPRGAVGVWRRPRRPRGAMEVWRRSHGHR